MAERKHHKKGEKDEKHEKEEKGGEKEEKYTRDPISAIFVGVLIIFSGNCVLFRQQ